MMKTNGLSKSYAFQMYPVVTIIHIVAVEMVTCITLSFFAKITDTMKSKILQKWQMPSTELTIDKLGIFITIFYVLFHWHSLIS